MKLRKLQRLNVCRRDIFGGYNLAQFTARANFSVIYINKSLNKLFMYDVPRINPKLKCWILKISKGTKNATNGTFREKLLLQIWKYYGA